MTVELFAVSRFGRGRREQRNAAAACRWIDDHVSMNAVVGLHTPHRYVINECITNAISSENLF